MHHHDFKPKQGHCWPIYILIALFIASQFVLSSIAFASTSVSGFSFGTSRDLDRAGVSVVRLVASYAPLSSAGISATPTGGCGSSLSGLGVLVGSWTTAGRSDFTNWILTDSGLVNPKGMSCLKASATLSSIEIYANTAYASGVSNHLLQNIACQSGACSGGSILCHMESASVCSGVVLIAFQTKLPQPFVDIASGDQSTPVPKAIGLLAASAAAVSPTAEQASQFLTPTLVSATDEHNELGLPTVNSDGQLLDLNNKDLDPAGSIRDFVTTQLHPLQASNTNALHEAWNKGISDYYLRNYPQAQRDFQQAQALNAQFQAPSTFLTLPAFQSLPKKSTPGPARATPTTSQTSNRQNTAGPNWVEYTGLIGGVLLLGLILLFVSLTIVRRQRREREEFAELDRRAMADAERIAAQERAEHERKRQQAQSVQLAQQAQQLVPPVVNQAPPVPPVAAPPSIVKTTPVPQASHTPDPLCPNCRHSIPAGAAFCANCGFSLAPAATSETKVMTLPAIEQQQPAPVIPAPPPAPVSAFSVRQPREIGREQVQDEVKEDENAGKRVGQQLGNYKLVRLLGEGGFAEVYLGEHIHLGSYAAIKVLHSQLTREEREKFRMEARTLVRLVHPHIVRVLDFGIEDKVPFLVMDYAPNGTLRQRHPRGTRLPLATIIPYVKQVADALQFAHDQKLIHRDIKPENMLVGLRNEILLSDFGIAVVVQSSRYQGAQDMAGTIAYMAPEQIQVHPRSASDQYALGVVVYEWLCGDRPFHGSFTEIAIKHAVVPPPPLREKVPTLSPVVEQVVLRALAKDPKDRFESVGAFARALEGAR